MPGLSSVSRNHCSSLVEQFAARAAHTPDRTALVHPDGKRTEPDGRAAYSTVGYAALAATVSACAAGLENCDIRRGTRTAVLVPPGGDLLTLILALMHVGAVPVVVDPGMGVARMLDCLQRARVQAFIGVPKAQALRRLRPRAFTGVHSSVTVSGTDGAGLQKLIAAGAGRPQAKPVFADPDDLALIGYTTGSTGPAKPVELSAGMLVGMADGAESGHFTDDVATTLVTMPLMGVFDLAAGRTVVVPEMDMARVGATDPASIVDAARRFQVNAMFASPALLAPLAAYLAASKVAVPTLRLIVSGGAPVSPGLMEELRAVLPGDARVYSTYGATEALPMALLESREALTWPADGPAAGWGVCLGHPAPGMTVRTIAISDGPTPHWVSSMEVPPGEPGEIVVSGLAVSGRYFRTPEADADHKIQDGDVRWHRTGDIGWKDGAGRIWFCGRKSHRVRTADGDLHTERCENVFNSHPQVRRTALVGVGPNGRQRPVLCVELAAGTARNQWDGIETELRDLGAGNPMTRPIADFLLHPGFPVDVRHNAKIRRELLAVWADGRLTGSRRSASLALRAVPLAGWVYIAAWPLLPWHGPILSVLWWLDVFFSVVVHAAQIPAALREEQEHPAGRRPWAVAALTMLFGATWRRNGWRGRRAVSL
ncbi:Acyl-CoA synthetase (AMP-forming)/AMP-acid ligase II [Streptomyces sp. 2231.1]|uniref:fatty acid CoA ligase family protein n=1 Tax=Streptomyces sp. 2231.1 TaxID=1855347 RepID=UPI00089BCE31|nr:fatty acid CoA ligase family protein [Streptomyces sp. 2231.1]SEE72689.1 Acyl-CoA synthetase (AMP-forming)/AMP-acid ligase II [Streptomyces sp. 2231.1]